MYIKEEKIFKDIETGLKTIEIRALSVLKKQDIKVHDLIEFKFNRSSVSPSSFRVQVLGGNVQD